jgi:IS5 family transposase
VVRQCRSAGLVSAETIHIDASLIRADVSMDALIERHLGTVDEMNDAERMARSSGKYKKLCRSDPEASMATSSRQPLRPSYKQHTAVDDHSGIVVDVEIVTGEEHDTNRLEQRLDAIEQAPGRAAGRITADASYGIGRVYAALEERDTDYVIRHRKPVRRRESSGFPIERFKYDARHDIVRCPARKILTPRNRTSSGQVYRAEREDCAGCPLRQRCIPGSAPSRRVHIARYYTAILRARHRPLRWAEDERAIYTRHRWQVEGAHGTAKVLHGLDRAIRRGLENMKIQSLLTAIAMILKKLARQAMIFVLAFVQAKVRTTEPAST